MIIVADTSALYAAFDEDQAEHNDAVSIMENQTLVISPLVITELDHLLHRDFGFTQTLAVMEALNDRFADGLYRLATLSQADLSSAHDIRKKYASRKLDLADAIGVVLADRHKTNRIFTLDLRDFRAIKPLSPQFSAFHILPADRIT